MLTHRPPVIGFRFRGILLTVMCCFCLQSLNAQDITAPSAVCEEKDLTDLLRKWMNKQPKKKDTTDQSSLLLLPIFGSNPATGFLIGVGGQFAFKMPESRRYSMIMGSMSVTSKKQFMIQVKNNIFSRKEKFFLTGDWRFQIFSQSTFGLGTNAPEGGILDYQYALAGLETGVDSLAQPMKFTFARLHQSAGIRIKPNVYLGLGYHFDGYFNIKDEKLRLNPGDTLLTSHYGYNTRYGYDTRNYYSSAFHATIVVDKRDNMIQARKGYFLQLGWRGAFEFIGSDRNGNMFNLEWRSFHGLSKRNDTHLIAFWLLGDMTGEGRFPYMILPATAYDQRGRSARGYTQGRFRGNNYVYAEAEYRFPISPCGGVLGGVLFVNGTTASNPAMNLPIFGSIKPGYGMGLRVMLDKKSRSNLALDWGFGNRSSGFYLAVSETF